ncbi:hypothetical protein GO755_09900 [Spirosoma sp. HMF4905]|uniref:Peptidase M56 domain-containing protein n=1 Tax=Spirosoma arboris TaxID=2682092 RepID=A0A7K1S9Z6_9BACT|nr:M56 family metallopeptidase [Spirosoma arboris]MVM30346.1 hypothetical protein [Spirosoma arboris]
MIVYLLKSSLCLIITFGFYKLWLENEQMHVFKRFYLLGSLVVSMLIPLISFDSWFDAAPLTPEVWDDYTSLYSLTNARPATQIVTVPTNAGPAYGLWLYGIVTAVMLGRFVKNLYTLARKIYSHPKQSFHGATLVELPGNGSPYTFLHYLFLPDYSRNELENELVTHELTHIRQRHSLDVLFVELLLCFGWFNPLLSWFKRAIQLNHEFLADAAVTQTYQDVPHYQRLLLSKLTLTGQLSLTSSLTFQTTKQRLIMMTKHTTPIRIWLTGGSTALLFGTLCLLLGNVSSAQQLPTADVQTATPNRLQSKPNVEEMERLYGDNYVMLPIRKGGRKETRKKFSNLSTSEKQQVRLIPFAPELVPTEAQLSDWGNSQKYGIWIDEKRVPNEQLNQYTPQDFGSYYSSKLEKNAANYGKYYFQIGLMTKPFYEKYVKKSIESPFLVLVDHKTKAMNGR